MATGRGSQGPEFEAFVLGHPKGTQEAPKGQLWACPFSHRVLLLLEEKEIPYGVDYVDKTNKPGWITDVNPEGTLPILKDQASGQYLHDSDVISDFLEDKYPATDDSGKRPLRKLSDCPQPAPQVFPKFMSYLKAKQGSQEEESAKRELQEQLQMADDALPNDSPYAGGKDVCAYDLALAPRLYIARQGCKLLKDWDWGDEYDNLKAYLHRMSGRPSWRNTASWDDESIAADLRREMQ